jgi:anti-sigma factor RsiW
MMTRDQFNAALDRHGGDLSRWPASLRQEAEALIAGDAGAASEFETARRLDALLAEAVAPSRVDAALIGRIVSRPGARRSEAVFRPTRRLIGWASAAMAATLVIGFVAGTVLPADQSSDAIAALLFSGAEEDIGGGLL